MQNNYPHLDKPALFELLSKRFSAEDKKLSQIPNPALLQDATKSAKKIASAIAEKKKITLIGDYDVDGVSSTAIMVDFFRQIPYPLEAIIPNRFNDGYGVSPNVLNRVDADLVITVDNGIAAIQAAKVCKERGIDLIITDHHTPSEILPEAFAIIDPKLSTCQYPFKEICGAQVAWLLLGLLKKELNLKIDMRQFLDILAIAIIADIMPLIDINRTLVKEGLKVLMTSNRPSSIIIRDFLNKSSITSDDIAFQIAPRINAAGRVEDASIALAFYTASSTNEAYKQFELLGQLNAFRKETEAECTKKALACGNHFDDVIVVSGDDWHEGVVGIVAARLVEHFSKPAIVLSCSDGVAKGSARSIGDVNIYELIKANESYLSKFGGHKMAAGLGLQKKDIDAFRVAINQTAARLNPDDFIPKEQITGILSSEDIDLELLNLLESFEPYGEANPRPTFLLHDAQVLNIKLMGADKSHSRIEILQFPHAKKSLELIAFRTVFQMPSDRKISCSYSVAKNEFNNRVSVQLLINKIY
ncbi:MAG: single-stranded-DNA-specific exonuclease RecJ [Epsilonproteobacteria bacterium]|nr:single-stranded-DNA-specific exonuclease RecJ [Campylobacterota bacterium]OIO17569.1 MAG: single-stranded-DNA-specific exonuclease RecJ [Helicobacteraceae bacterium CG1_02_36_14]PIP10957.1 MAG: single-stranded-DNA-specific exonuclease RecJ [Sulfurimonas sp. CG23_combo_of_CG06-09_8_20_14_all_36_33]PIS25700.1 MAG: single-stranded-DNA-specific exonuclease RecJ [Sulfurimonas sp. CG08_land_8_20_14_0_20_36_33]PIU34806.1 MAG: single-stranded-DNA-specific exonuclease RecJ [Sulfurimonas sp. CG07_land